MKTKTALRISITLLSLAIAGSLAAQQTPQDFPAKRDRPATCDDFRWNADMTRDYPRVVDACQEAVNEDGTTWARLAARFVQVQTDGLVVFSIRDKNDRAIEQISMEPKPGQVAYIDDRATEFDKLRTTDTINLYVPEGEYGYATRPLAQERFTRVAPVAAATTAPPPATVAPPEPDPEPVALAFQDEPTPSRLPQTASMLPWAGFGGGLMLLVALGMGLRRKM